MARYREDDKPITLAEAGERHFDTVVPGERYRLRMPGLLLQLEADRLRWERHELFGLLSVSLDLPGVVSVGGLAESSTLNFSSLRARTERASLLSRITRTSDYPWQDIVQFFALEVIKHEQLGDAPVDLASVEIDPSIGQSETVLGLPILRYDETLIVGRGGDGKSAILLRILGELSHRGYSCAYLDSEWNETVHGDRLGRLFTQKPSVKYMRLSRPLSVEIDRVRRFVHEIDADFVGFDSVGQSVDAPMETSEAALNYLRAVRSIGRRGKILISHVKHDQGDGSNKRPYGSTYWLNGVRSAWHVKAAAVSTSRYEVVLEHIKVNAGPRLKPVALELAFDDNRIAIEQMHTSDLGEQLQDSLPIRDRIVATLKRRGALSLDELSDALDVKRDTIKRTLNRGLAEVFARVGTDPKVQRFGLLERRPA